MKIQEMANCRSKKTGLPMNIWIDETGSYLKGSHSKRMKFQINTSSKFQTENTCSMTLDGVIPRQQEEKRVLSKIWIKLLIRNLISMISGLLQY